MRVRKNVAGCEQKECDTSGRGRQMEHFVEAEMNRLHTQARPLGHLADRTDRVEDERRVYKPMDRCNLSAGRMRYAIIRNASRPRLRDTCTPSDSAFFFAASITALAVASVTAGTGLPPDEKSPNSFPFISLPCCWFPESDPLFPLPRSAGEGRPAGSAAVRRRACRASASRRSGQLPRQLPSTAPY